ATWSQLADMPMVTPAHAAETGPGGFADVVQKVKPAVISVRVKLRGDGATVGSNESGGGQLPFPKCSPFEPVFRQVRLPEFAQGTRHAAIQACPGVRILHLRRRLCGDQ